MKNCDSKTVSSSCKDNMQTTGFTKFESTSGETSKPAFYINPVCGLPVDITNPKHVVQNTNEIIFLYWNGCKVKIDADPEKYSTLAIYEEM